MPLTNLFRENSKPKIETVKLGGQTIPVEPLPPGEALVHLFNFAPLMEAITYQRVTEEHVDAVIRFVATCANRRSEWVTLNASLEEITYALTAFLDANGMVQSFMYLEALGWVGEDSRGDS